MRAQEFVTEYERDTSSSKQIFAKLQQLGYTKLGDGQDATVWSKDEGTVIKILMPSDLKADYADKNFLTFYNFCQQHTDLPNLPKFIDVGGAHHTAFEIDGRPYRQIAMERLQPIKNGTFEEAMVWILSDLAATRAPWKVVVEKLLDAKEWNADGSGIMSRMPELIRAKLNDERFNAEYNMLLLTMQMLYMAGQKASLGWDLHTENVMQRRDGTLVIVDPYFT